MDVSSKSLVKKCRVCGDLATAFNFNGHLSFECCKIFFRRNHSRKLKCRLEGKCEIDFMSRKNCPACRLAKCISIGMKMKPKPPVTKPNNSNINLLTDKSIREMLQTEISPVDSCKCHKIKRSRKKQTLKLTTFELDQIEMIQQLMKLFPEENELPVVGYSTDFDYSFSLPGLYAKRIVKFCKSMEAFRLLPLEDQFLILKSFYFELCSVRFSFSFDDKRDCFKILENETGQGVYIIPIEILRHSMPIEMAEENRRITLEANMAMENDKTIRNLLCAQFLFKPRENVSNKEFLRYHYFFYQYLLQRYLEHKYQSVKQAAQKYQKLMAVYSDEILNRCKQNLTKIMSEVKLNPIGKVLEEVFETYNKVD